MVGLIRPAPEDVFVEIGAGAGALTVRLAPRVSRLFAVEFDRDVIPALAAATSPWPSVAIVEDDALCLDLQAFENELPAGQRLRVAGNLPYNIGTAVLEKFLYAPIRVYDMTFMLQLEVAQRIVARPGSRDYGFLSVRCSHRADAVLAFRVRPGSFAPPPKVMSAVIVLRPKPVEMTAEQEDGFRRVASAAFGHRRKTLLNALRHSDRLADAVPRLLERAAIDGSRRPEDLTVGEYEKLGRIFAEIS